MKRKMLIGILGVVLVGAVGGWFWLDRWLEQRAWLSHPYENGQAAREHRQEELGPSRYYRFAFEGTFDGAAVSVDQMVECVPYLSGTGTPFSAVRLYEKIPKLAGQRLADNAGVYFEVPAFCGRRHFKSLWTNREPLIVIPRGYWVDDVDNLSIGEMYVSRVYYDHPEARLKITSSIVEFMPEGFVPEEPLDRQNWFPIFYSQHERQERLKRGRKENLPLMALIMIRVDDLPVPLSAELLAEVLINPVAISDDGRIEAYRKTPAFEAWWEPITNARSTYYGRTFDGAPLNINDITPWQKRHEKMVTGEKVYSEILSMQWLGGNRYTVTSVTPGWTGIKIGLDNRLNLYQKKELLITFFSKSTININKGTDATVFLFYDNMTSRLYLMHENA